MDRTPVFPSTVVAMHYTPETVPVVTVEQSPEGQPLRTLAIKVDNERVLQFYGSTRQVVHVREALLAALAALPPLFDIVGADV